MVTLGEGFRPRAEVVEEIPPPPPDTRVEELLEAVVALKEAVAGIRLPDVHVPAADLGDIVTAVNSLKPHADADDIAKAIARELRIPEPVDPTGALAEVAEALKALDFRMKGIGGPAFGASGPSNIASDPNREMGKVSVKEAPDLASEATLATLATEASVTTLVDNQFRRTDPLATGTNIIGFTSPSVSKKVGEGKFFIADSGQLTTTVTNNWASFTLENPAGSGKTLYIVAVTLETDTTAWGKFYRGPTTNLPTTARTAYNAINLLSSGNYVASGLVKGDAMASEMNNATTLVSRVTNNTPLRLDMPPIILSAGSMVGFGINVGGTGNASVAAYWYEE